MKISEKQLRSMRTLIHQLGWKEFMLHVGSFMAEQADKMDYESEQSVALFRASSLFHSDHMMKHWETCGHFNYPLSMVDEEGGE